MQLTKNRRVKAAVILDELSVVFFAKEWEIINLTTEKWYSEITSFSPDLLFVESAWRGADALWGRKLVRPDQTLGRLICWCRENGIVTVFWNKEDPIHFNTFLRAAQLFDWVFTTDLDCMKAYQERLRKNQIGLFLFAAAVPMFHPMEEQDRKEAIAFAGSYYRRRKKRCTDFEHMYDWSKEYLPIDIFDRKSNVEDAYYRYPAKYQGSLKEARPLNEMAEIYKEYEYHFTVNTVTTSTTMEARRIFELMASNTLVISNECKAVHVLFGDLVLYCNSEQEFKEKIKGLSREKEFYNQCRLKALRKVLMEHTFRARIKRLEQTIWNKKRTEEEKGVVVLAVAKSDRQYRILKKAFDRQSYPVKELRMLSKETHSLRQEIGSKIKDDWYYAFFNASNYYGENYLLDLMLATQYSSCGVIGKGCYYEYERFSVKKKQIENRYRYIDGVKWDRCIIIGSRLRQSLEEKYNEGLIIKEKTASIDEYNFCANRSRGCKQAAEIQIDCGHSMAELYKAERRIMERRQ